MAYARSLALQLAATLPAFILGVALLGAPHSGVQAADWPPDAYVLQVDGLACPYCGYGIEKQFHKQDGVEGTEIDIENGVVVVSVAPGTRFSDSDLRKIVDDAGFELGELMQEPAAD